MALDRVYLGQTFQVDSFFKDQDDPVIPSNPAQWTIYDFNNLKVLGGIAAQDTGNPFRWYADVVIPESAPASHTKKYRIEWSIRSNKGTFSNSEYFNVVAQEGFDFTEIDTVYIEGDEIQDNLIIPYNEVASDFKVTLMDSDGKLISQTTQEPLFNIVDNKKVYGLTIEDSEITPAALKPYIVGWNYKVDGRSRREYHFVYVISPRVLFYIEQLRNFIDKVRFSHPNPRLRFNDVDLLGYLVQGVQIINGTKPTPTDFGLETVPKMFEWYLTNAAAYVGLSAQYLAEGQQAFDFSGQTVTLTVDRTQFIDSFLGRVQEVISTQLVEAKTLYAKSSARPVLGLSPGPCLNTRYLGLYFYGGSSDPSLLLGSRDSNYQTLLGQLL